MFGHKEDSAQQAMTPDTTAPEKGRTPGKGVPTPRRKDAEKARRRPIVASTAALTKEEKRKLKAENRAKNNELYYKQQTAMRTGDEKNMPPAHRGHVRRWGRDYIDAAAPLGQWFMPLVIPLLLLAAFMSYWPLLAFWATIGIYIIFLLMVIQLAWIVRNAKILAAHKFGKEEIPNGFAMQLFSRGMYMPRWRLPSPQVKRGEYPAGATAADLSAAKAAKKTR
ncbi:DUF3043 domain-containing protein [Arcanobacterium haemolyticum]|uniref:Integral membrane protein n=1 Tax=Arcanobacterium haemolyticum (strain ATCC 9345 / DSM 20595 / CCM 5947 / CCUG 17215 / LMG 16163 / NBRC 15585 / NCTC 8452 / 11018) TaxID=644284 RepID=D7BNH6_ARCHD|nr:DUF3043 domain-containing protein [Arcanobacterium haemolyticum]ADH92475.1 putative integral membrane protein [Arcanobacterium haemolyticum DSM 20595]SPT75433.1 Protein of uncharacterised function (DUF3043) [Arcanobacterium haemolyticum]SQH28795.1 Protein of uncharacterised function (DUF3043) [Arcanobacterium haemolyticum]